MNSVAPFVITISRQRGCGGAYLGQRLAQALDIRYVDRQIVEQCAQALKVPVEVIEGRDEKNASLWTSIVESLALSNIYSYMPPPLYVQDDASVHEQEDKCICSMAGDTSAVIVGRAGFHVLRNHPRHLSVFLHASEAYRTNRLCELYKMSRAEAESTIARTDKDRSLYIQSLTGKPMTDATQYDLSIDTGKVGLEGAESIILATVKAKFGTEAVGDARVLAG
jgi:cytidylate kinase